MRLNFWKRNTESEDIDLGFFSTEGKLPDRKSFLRKAAQLYQFLIGMNVQLARHEKELSQTLRDKQKDIADLQTYFEIVADCQKKTAELVNQTLERHALHPAILAVDMFAKIINSLSSQAEGLTQPGIDSPQVAEFIEVARDACRVAALKKEQLGIQEIRPKEFDPLDKDHHQIVKVIATDDITHHKKIHETVVAGTAYQGKTLRPAKVSVYRFSEQQPGKQA